MVDVVNEGVTTMLTNITTSDKTMNGNETYPIIGELLDDKLLREVFSECNGLNIYWGCLEKALIVKKHLGKGIVVLGQCMAVSLNGKSAYGHYWNPPLEFHAWWQESLYPKEQSIIDISLPGLIMKGSESFDEIGFLLTGRSPIVLAGVPENWMRYTPVRELIIN